MSPPPLPAPSRSLSLSQARRVALAAQGLDRRRPVSPVGAAVTLRGLQRVVDQLGLLQIDSVNVLARAHLMPLYSRLGPYDPALLDRAAGEAPRRLVEAWAHEASFVPPTTFRLLGWRQRGYLEKWWADTESFMHSHATEIREIRELVRAEGPVTARDVHSRFEARHPRTGTGWWEWSVSKRVLEHLFFIGELASAGRNSAFERRYDVVERVLPAHVLAAPEPTDDDAVRALVEIGARAHGIGTEQCLRDYFRLGGVRARKAIDELVEEGTLEAVTVRGWNRQAYLHSGARLPRRASGRTLLSPFDPLVFERRRLLDLFGMHYRIEIYTPSHKRVHGYYVLPFLLGEQLAARVDLKADRARKTLLVQSAFREHDAPDETARELAAELRELARWLGLDSIEVASPRLGDLAARLAGELARVG